MLKAVPLKFTLNDRPATVTTDPQRSLLEVLRESLHLTGTKYGCGEGACGACAVLVDGRKILSCTTPASEVNGKQLITIEGLARGDQLHPAQEAFLTDEAFQCGYCTPGIIIATVALLRRTPAPDQNEIRQAINGHLCRCCGYSRIEQVVRRVVGEAAARE